jgi:hypothetical protein
VRDESPGGLLGQIIAFAEQEQGQAELMFCNDMTASLSTSAPLSPDSEVWLSLG